MKLRPTERQERKNLRPIISCTSSQTMFLFKKAVPHWLVWFSSLEIVGRTGLFAYFSSPGVGFRSFGSPGVGFRSFET